MRREQLFNLRVDEAQADSFKLAAPLAGHSPPGVIDQHVPHHFGGDGVEVGATGPGRILLIRYPQVSFMNKRGRFEQDIAALVANESAGQRAEFIVDEGKKLVGDGLVSIAPY